MSETVLAGIILVTIMLVVIGIPCVGAAVMGYKMINQIGNWPSKTPAIQMGLVFKLAVLEGVSFFLLILFYHLLADYGS